MFAWRQTLAILIKQQSVLSLKRKMDHLTVMRARHFWRKPYDKGFITGAMARMKQQAFPEKFDTFCHTRNTIGFDP
jgi:hypothetical protein